jgi:exodeoxyribonuclease V alpha subunit
MSTNFERPASAAPVTGSCFEAGSTTLTGRLVSAQVYGSGWGRGTVQTDQLLSVNVVGNALSGLEVGGRYEFAGLAMQHATYGLQFEAAGACVDIPMDHNSLVKHLCKNFTGVGEVTAKKLVALHVKAGTLGVLRGQLVRDPFSVDFSTVTNREIVVDSEMGLPELIYRDLATRIGAISNSRVIRSLAEWLAKRVEGTESPLQAAWAMFSTNPYGPISSVSGYAFLGADAIGHQLTYAFDSPCRMAALVTHVLDDGCLRSGHAFLTLAQLTDRMAVFDRRVSVADAVAHAITLGEPIIEDDGRYYLTWLRAHEMALASMFRGRLDASITAIYQGAGQELAGAIEMAQVEIGFEMDPSQRAALIGALTSNQSVHSVTAGPGCGKTALMEILVEVVGNRRRFLFAGPTGKSAKVLSGRIARWGVKATTIHSMLGATRDGFTFNAGNQLAADIIIADETSMDDLALMAALMAAVAAGTHVIFLGDTKQLPSVGPGNCLADLLKLGFDHHRLTKTHRNDGGILEVVGLAGNGVVDNKNRRDVTFSGSLPEATEEGVAGVLADYLAAVENVGGDMAKVGLLIAKRKGDAVTPGWNVTYLNARLKGVMNPDGCKIVGSSLTVGDRIIIRKNQSLEQGKDAEDKKVYEVVVNGDTGFIRDFEVRAGNRFVVDFLTLELDDGRVISYPGAEMDVIGLAYAMTVHAAQGSEYERVIFVCANGSPSFIHSGILFTAFSRAKKHLHVVGEPKVIALIAKRPIPRRNSSLVERVKDLGRVAAAAGAAAVDGAIGAL